MPLEWEALLWRVHMGPDRVVSFRGAKLLASVADMRRALKKHLPMLQQAFEAYRGAEWFGRFMEAEDDESRVRLEEKNGESRVRTEEENGESRMRIETNRTEMTEKDGQKRLRTVLRTSIFMQCWAPLRSRPREGLWRRSAA